MTFLSNMLDIGSSSPASPLAFTPASSLATSLVFRRYYILSVILFGTSF